MIAKYGGRRCVLSTKIVLATGLELFARWISLGGNPPMCWGAEFSWLDEKGWCFPQCDSCDGVVVKWCSPPIHQCWSERFCELERGTENYFGDWACCWRIDESLATPIFGMGSMFGGLGEESLVLKWAKLELAFALTSLSQRES